MKSDKKLMPSSNARLNAAVSTCKTAFKKGNSIVQVHSTALGKCDCNLSDVTYCTCPP